MDIGDPLFKLKATFAKLTRGFSYGIITPRLTKERSYIIGIYDIQKWDDESLDMMLENMEFDGRWTGNILIGYFDYENQKWIEFCSMGIFKGRIQRIRLKEKY